MQTKSLLQKQLEKCNYVLELTKNLQYTKFRIEVSNPNSKPQFNIVNKSTNSREFLSKSDEEEIHKLCQEEYLRKMRLYAKKRRTQLIQILKNFNDDEFENIYRNMQPIKKQYINHITTIPEQYIQNWQNEEYISRGFYKNERFVTSQDGTKYRSKTERTLAQLFISKGIFFKYEAMLQLENITIYPDFTFLSPKTLKEIYWEHFGMMDDPNYSKSVHKKIREYERNGIYLGERLIITFEYSENDLDYSWVNELIDRFLL